MKEKIEMTYKELTNTYEKKWLVNFIATLADLKYIHKIEDVLKLIEFNPDMYTGVFSEELLENLQYLKTLMSPIHNEAVYSSNFLDAKDFIKGLYDRLDPALPLKEYIRMALCMAEAPEHFVLPVDVSLYAKKQTAKECKSKSDINTPSYTLVCTPIRLLK